MIQHLSGPLAIDQTSDSDANPSDDSPKFQSQKSSVGSATQRRPGMSLRRRMVVEENGQVIRAGKHHAASRPPEKEPKRFLTPFLHQACQLAAGNPNSADQQSVQVKNPGQHQL
jgi:hypothetical protein